MSVLYVALPVALLIAVIAVVAFIWSLRMPRPFVGVTAVGITELDGFGVDDLNRTLFSEQFFQRVQLQSSLLDGAIDQWKQIANHLPHYAESWATYGTLLNRAKRREEAEAALGEHICSAGQGIKPPARHHDGVSFADEEIEAFAESGAIAGT